MSGVWSWIFFSIHKQTLKLWQQRWVKLNRLIITFMMFLSPFMQIKLTEIGWCLWFPFILSKQNWIGRRSLIRCLLAWGKSRSGHLHKTAARYCRHFFPLFHSVSCFSVTFTGSNALILIQLAQLGFVSHLILVNRVEYFPTYCAFPYCYSTVVFHLRKSIPNFIAQTKNAN